MKDFCFGPSEFVKSERVSFLDSAWNGTYTKVSDLTAKPFNVKWVQSSAEWFAS